VHPARFPAPPAQRTDHVAAPPSPEVASHPEAVPEPLNATDTMEATVEGSTLEDAPDARPIQVLRAGSAWVCRMLNACGVPAGS
jgi:hypothetical protein